MSKKLKIQFWKAEKSLAMQILEQEGLPKNRGTGFIRIAASPSMDLAEVQLRGYFSDDNYKISSITFNSNSMRDIYLKNTIDSITNALFSHGKEELSIGEMCEVWDLELKKWQKRKLLAILPENYEERFIVANLCYPNRYVPFSDARPISKRIEPKIEECGNVVTYTWEEK